MRAVMLTLSAALIGTSLLPWPVLAQTVALRAEGKTANIECAGAAAQIGGNRNKVTFTGACRELQIRGEANTVTIELAPAAELDIEGGGNRVRYTQVGGTQPPRLHISGSDTDVGPQLGAPIPMAPPQPAELNGNNERLELDCTDRPVLIQGNSSHYALRGGCPSITIRGDGNSVMAELSPNATLTIEGNATGVTYSVRGAGAATVTVHGLNSFATQTGPLPSGASTPTPPAAPPPASPPPASPPPTSPPPAPPSPGSASPAPAIQAAPIPAVQRSVPALMHDLGAKVVASGTVVGFQADLLFDGDTANLHDDAATRLASLLQLIRQINPTGLMITGQDPLNADLARRRAASLRAWLVDGGRTTLPVTVADAVGAANLSVLILR